MYKWAINKSKLDRAMKSALNYKEENKRIVLTGDKLEAKVKEIYISLGGLVDLTAKKENTMENEEIKKEEEVLETPVEMEPETVEEPAEEMTVSTDDTQI